nr:MAG TPA: hypothetical protein [Caudoviricetes sp.]
MKRIVRGNDFTMRIPVVKIVEGEKVAFPLPGCTDIVVRLCSAYRRLELAYTIDAKEDNVIVARVEGDRIPLGTYALEVRGKIFGNDWRSNEYEQVAIVDRNADADTELGETDEGENSVEMDTAVVVLPPDRELEALVKEAQAQNKAMSELSDAIKVSEEGRVKSEELRAKSEAARVQAELTRASNEAERVQAEQVRESAENARADAENARVTAEGERVTAESERVTAENARTEAAAKAVADCEAASAGAERCNVTMEGSTITVTNRDGEQNTVNVVDTDEKVTVTIKSSVDSVKVSGITVSVYFNRDTKSPLKIVTDTGGKASFTARRGEYYELKFPEYGAAQPIAPVGFTAVLPEREVSVTYMSYDKDNSEEVAITVARYPDGKYAAWANKEVKCTYDGNTTSFFTGTDGKVSIYVPLGKTYTITVDNEDGYSVQNGQNKISHTAELSYRGVSFFFYQYATGLWCVTEDGTAYTIDDWLATGRDGGEVVAIKFASYNLITHKGVFAFRTSDLTNVAGLTKTKWSSASIFFPSIPNSGYQSGLPYFYNGQDATTLIRQDAATLEVSADAADAACGQTLDIGGKTLRGFLPGGGQINMFLDNMVQLRDILAKIYGEDVSEDFYTNLGACWSCIQHATSNGLCFNTNKIDYSSKGTLLKILPAFPL